MTKRSRVTAAKKNGGACWLLAPGACLSLALAPEAPISALICACSLLPYFVPVRCMRWGMEQGHVDFLWRLGVLTI